jgi:hypothetical protein
MSSEVSMKPRAVLPRGLSSERSRLEYRTTFRHAMNIGLLDRRGDPTEEGYLQLRQFLIERGFLDPAMTNMCDMVKAFDRFIANKTRWHRRLFRQNLHFRLMIIVGTATREFEQAAKRREAKFHELPGAVCTQRDLERGRVVLVRDR